MLLGEQGFVFWEVQVSGVQVLGLGAGAPAELSLVRAGWVSPGHGVTLEKRHQPIKQDPRDNPRGNIQRWHHPIAASPSPC